MRAVKNFHGPFITPIQIINFHLLSYQFAFFAARIGTKSRAGPWTISRFVNLILVSIISQMTSKCGSTPTAGENFYEVVIKIAFLVKI